MWTYKSICVVITGHVIFMPMSLHGMHPGFLEMPLLAKCMLLHVGILRSKICQQKFAYFLTFACMVEPYGVHKGIIRQGKNLSCALSNVSCLEI